MAQLLEEVLDQVLLGQVRDQLDLLQRDTGQVRDCARKLDGGAAVRGERAEQLFARDEWERDPARPLAPRELRPELGQLQRVACLGPAGGLRPEAELLAAASDQVHGA